jgi:hypothetical protein
MQSCGDSAIQEIRESENLMIMMMILEPKISENLMSCWWWFCNPRYQRLWWADDDDSATQEIRESDIELLLMMILQPKRSENLRSWWRLWDSDEILQQLKRIWWDNSFESLLAHTFVCRMQKNEKLRGLWWWWWWWCSPCELLRLLRLEGRHLNWVRRWLKAAVVIMWLWME